MSSGQRRAAATSASAAKPIPKATPPTQGYTEVARSVLHRLRDGIRRSSSHSTPTDQLTGKSSVARGHAPISRQDGIFKTRCRIRALDTNQAKTHVVLAGGRILRTVRIDDGPGFADDFDLRTAAVNLPWSSSVERDLDPSSEYSQEIIEPAALDRETFDIEDVAWSNHEYKDSIATAARNGKIMLYNIKRPGMEVARLHEHLQQVHKVDFNPLEGGILLSGSQDGTVRLWDLRSLQRSAMLCSSRDTYQGRNQGVRHVKWSPTSTWTFAFCTDNGNVQRWDTRNNRTPLLKLFAHDRHCNTVDWHPDGRHLASGGEDGLVKVWNMAPEEPRSKPIIILRAPHGIQNVRWRPSCIIDDLSDASVTKQCTHLATSYRKYPVVHVWDLRRPFIPFREIHHPHNMGTTDMLWRNRDLLWTVGSEGDFMQTDVPFAPKTLDRRPLSTFAIAPSGEINLFIMKRHNPHGFNTESKARNAQSAVFQKSQGTVTHELAIGRSPGDDSIDEKFLGSLGHRRRSRTPSLKSGKSTGTTPPSIENTAKSDTLDLGRTMNDFHAFKQWQTPKIGPLPGIVPDLVLTYMAQKCKVLSILDVEFFKQIRNLFEQNATYAQRASRYREAQTWRIIGLQVEKDLQRRAATNRQKRLSLKHQETVRATNAALLKSPEVLAPSSPTQTAQTSLVKSTTELSPKSRVLKVSESTSNVPTPLVQPVHISESEATHSAHASLQPEPEITGDLCLPPSLIALRQAKRVTPTVSASTMSDISDPEPNRSDVFVSDEHLISTSNYSARPTFERETSADSFAMFSMSTDSDSKLSKSTSFVSHGSDNSSRKRRASNDLSAHDRYGHRTTDSLLENTEHVTDLSGSDSSNHSQIFASSFDGDLVTTQLQEMNTSPATDALSHTAAQALAQAEINNEMDTIDFDYIHSMEDRFDEEDTQNKPMLLETESSRLTYFPFSPPTAPLLLPQQSGPDFDMESNFVLADFLNDPSGTESPLGDMTDIAAALTPQEPLNLTAIHMLKELIDYYTDLGDARMVSQLYQLTSTVITQSFGVGATTDSVLIDDEATEAFYDYLTGSPLNMSHEEAIQVLHTHTTLQSVNINPGQVESFLMLYHSELLVRNLLGAAAVLRRFCFPAMPAVYEVGQIDILAGLLCTGCNNPIHNPNRRVCDSCGARQAPCAFCDAECSPYESPYEQKKKPKSTDSPLVAAAASSYPGASPGSAIWQACQVCNHSLHIACALVWFADAPSNGVCATQGCLCECSRGGEVEKVVVRGEGPEDKGKGGRTVRFSEG